MKHRSSWALGLGPWACVLTAALTVSASAQQSEKPIFRAGTNLIRLDVRIVDRDGKPITDLRQDEVEVIDAGASRPILLFHRVGSQGRTYVEAAQRTIASEVSTNQGAPQGQLYILVFDQDHIRSGGEQPVRVAAEAFLRERVRPEDRIAVYGLPGPGPSLGFTKDVASARRQLSLVHGTLDRQSHGGATAMSLQDAYELLHGNERVLMKYLATDSATEASGGASSLVTDTRRSGEDAGVAKRVLRENAQLILSRADADTRRFLVAFSDLLRTLKTIDGRKSVMLFSEGFYGDNVARELEDVAAAAAESYSVIYAFDLNKRNDFASANETTAYEGTDIAARIDPIGGLAAETSGELIKDASTWTKQAMASLLPEDETYYVLGFDGATPAPGDNAYRRVSIRTTRPGAKVVARSGYSRPDAGSIATPAEARKAVDAAFGAPFTQQGLKIEYTTFVTDAVAAGPQRVVLSLAAELPVRRADDDAADVKCMVRESRSGALADNGAGRMLLPARADGGFSTGRASWLVAFDLPPADYLMRCVVREPGGVIGSADRRFRVRAITGADVTATDLLLRTPGETLPVRARSYTTGALSGTMRVYAPGGDKLRTVSARLELTPATADASTRTGRTIDGVVGEVTVQPNGAARREILFSMPLEHLAAGDYIARATIRVDGEVVADTGRPVEIVDGAEPVAVAPTGGRDPRGVLKGAFAQRIIQHAGTLPDQRYREAAIEAASGQWAAVMPTLAPMPAADPIAQRLRGLAQLAREEYVAAAASLAASFDLRNDADVAIVLGWARIGANDLPGAISAFRSAALIQPELEPAYEALSNTYQMAGQRALAVQALKQGLEKLPNSARLTQLLSEINK